MHKSPDLRFDKESKGYLLNPMRPRDLMLESLLRGASQIQSIKSRIYLNKGPLRLNFKTYGQFTLPMPQV